MATIANRGIGRETEPVELRLDEVVELPGTKILRAGRTCERTSARPVGARSHPEFIPIFPRTLANLGEYRRSGQACDQDF